MADHLSDRMADAIAYAVQLHGRDSRKGTRTPVLAHLFAVCALVLRDGGDEDEAIAALLHDALEDKPESTSAREIEERFGARVRRIVEMSTDTGADYRGGPKAPWRERKERYLAHVREAPPEDLRVTVADKVDNVRAILDDHRQAGDALWGRFNAGKEDQLWYYESAARAYRAAGFGGPMLEELEALVSRLAAVVRG